MLELLGLLCTIPTAYLTFKERAIKNYIDQCHDLVSKGDLNYKKGIRLDYRIFAEHILGVKGDLDFLQVFGGSASEIKQRIEYDKSDAVRGFFWFIAAFIFFLLAIFFRH